MWLVVVLAVLADGLGSEEVLRYCHGDPTFQDNSRPGFLLLQVQLLTRHGDRTPVHALPSFLENVEWNCSDSVVEDVEEQDGLRLRKRYFPGRQALKGNCMLGQLTARGEEQLRSLGKNFRSLYIDKLRLLSRDRVEPAEVFLRSTDVVRTVRSAYHFLAGLYPGANETVDLHLIERPRDNAFPNRFFCPYYGSSIDALKLQKNYSAFMKTHLDPLKRK